MKRKVLVGIITIILISIMLTFFSTTVFADEITDPMKPKVTDSMELINRGGKVLSVVQAVGISVAVIMLFVIGIRFMLASASDKAMIKEQLIPYVIGAILLFGTSAFLGIAFGIGNKINGLG